MALVFYSWKQGEYDCDSISPSLFQVSDFVRPLLPLLFFHSSTVQWTSAMVNSDISKKKNSTVVVVKVALITKFFLLSTFFSGVLGAGTAL